jgi:hypothetical protein
MFGSAIGGAFFAMRGANKRRKKSAWDVAKA